MQTEILQIKFGVGVLLMPLFQDSNKFCTGDSKSHKDTSLFFLEILKCLDLDDDTYIQAWKSWYSLFPYCGLTPVAAKPHTTSCSLPPG